MPWSGLPRQQDGTGAVTDERIGFDVIGVGDAR